jgi:hypothetical protein
MHCGLVNDIFEPGFVADPFIVETPSFLLQHDPTLPRWHMFFEVMNETWKNGDIAVASSHDIRSGSWNYRQVVPPSECASQVPALTRPPPPPPPPPVPPRWSFTRAFTYPTPSPSSLATPPTCALEPFPPFISHTFTPIHRVPEGNEGGAVTLYHSPPSSYPAQWSPVRYAPPSV